MLEVVSRTQFPWYKHLNFAAIFVILSCGFDNQTTKFTYCMLLVIKHLYRFPRIFLDVKLVVDLTGYGSPLFVLYECWQLAGIEMSAKTTQV